MAIQKRFFSGSSLAQALNQAAQHFQMPPSEIEYSTVDKKHGFLKVRRKVVIQVEVDEDDRPVRSRPAATPAERDEGTRETAPVRERTAETPEARPKKKRKTPRVEPDERPRSPEPEAEETRHAADESEDSGAGVEAAATGAETPDVRTRGWVSEPAAARIEEEVKIGEPSADRPPPRDSPEEPVRKRRRSGGRGRRRGGGARESDRVDLPEAPVPAGKRYPKARGEEAEAAAKALEYILEVGSLNLESEIFQGEEQLLVELHGSDQDILLRDRGRLLLAIQHLLPRAMRGLIGRSVPCRVDSDNFHEIREERLRDMAQRAADEVRRRGQPKTLEPMSPDERRIIHLTLTDYPGVETESLGNGLFKRVMVKAEGGRDRQRGRGPGPYSR